MQTFSFRARTYVPRAQVFRAHSTPRYTDRPRRRFVLLLTGRVAPAAPPRASGTADLGRTELLWEGVITVRPAWGETALPPRALRASWELLLPRYTEDAMLARAMDMALRGMPI